MGTFRFLHITDLHLGMMGQSPLWPNVEEIFLNDLKTLHDIVGPWELVLFTGDVTQRGSKAEFDEAEKLLRKFWQRFQEWGFSPKLLAIPGNHDLVRPSDETDPALINLLHTWNLPAVQTAFWNKSDSPVRKLVGDAFQNYTQWLANTSIPKPSLNSGLLPGDCSAFLEVDGLKVGFVGLNTAYLQLAGGDFKNKLHLDVRQLHVACDGHAADWVRQFDVCLLFTHHPVDWLTLEAQRQFFDEIHHPPERFALHLCGHMHEGNFSTIAHGGGKERRTLQSASLFGMEHWGEQNAVREHGYSLCEIKQDKGELGLRVWPRRVEAQKGGGRKIVRDNSFNLIEQDGGTHSISIARGAHKVAVLPTTRQPSAIATFDPRNPPFYVPYRQKGGQVIGRDEALRSVRRQLTTGRRTAIGQTAVLQGIGGLGKTQLAVEYAYCYRNEYPNGVIWLTADQDIDAQLVDLAVKARWVAPESEHKFKLEIAQHRLRSYSACLIVFDNLEQLDSIKNYLPEASAEPHILVTSREEQPDFTYVPIDVLEPNQSLQLLLQEAGRQPDSETDWSAAREIVSRLGGLPLALEMAGAYLARRLVGWQEYLDLLTHNLKHAFSNQLGSLTGHKADLYSTLQVSASVFVEEPRLKDTLDVLTWSAPSPMSVDLLAKLLRVADRSELTGALGLGTALRLLQKSPDVDAYAIHRLVREVRREEPPLLEESVWAKDVCERIGDWFYALREGYQHLPDFEANIDHLREWHEHSLKLAPVQTSRLTWLQAYPAYHRAQFQDVKRLIELAQHEYTGYGCEDLALLAHLQNDLGIAYCALGDTRHALVLINQALENRRKLYGDVHPDIVQSIHNVSGIVGELGNPKRALGMAEEALSISRKLYGEQHYDTAVTLQNVANLIGELGDAKRARQLTEQALAISRKLYGERHPLTALSLNSLSTYIRELGDLKLALEMAKQAFTIRSELFGERHPDTASSLGSVASHTFALGDHKYALELAEQVLAIRRELFGEMHPETASALNNLAVYIDKLGDSKRALELNKQALVIRRKFFGEHHPDTAMSLHNMAGYYLDHGNDSEAWSHAQAAHAILKHIYGNDHPKTLRTAKLLAKIKLPGFRIPSRKKAAKNGKKKRRC